MHLQLYNCYTLDSLKKVTKVTGIVTSESLINCIISRVNKLALVYDSNIFVRLVLSLLASVLIQ